MFNNDVLIITDTAAIKKKLKCDSIWFSVINQTTKINYRKFTIIVHKMWVTALNCSKQKNMIQQFLNQNMYFKNCSKILSTCWFKKALKKSKSHIYLIVNVMFLIQINLLISKDLLFHSKLKNCELFHKNCRIMQCFNCYEYEHIVRVCQKEKKYEICVTLDYDNHVCSFWNISARHKCINCNQNHTSWAAECNKKKKHVKKIWLAYVSCFR